MKKLLFLIGLMPTIVYSQTTYSYDLYAAAFDTYINPQAGDIIKFYNYYGASFETHPYNVEFNGVGVSGYYPTPSIGATSLIYSYEVLPTDVQFDIKVSHAVNSSDYRHVFVGALGLSDILNVGLTAYPNPVEEVVFINGVINFNFVEIVSLVGKSVVKTKTIEGGIDVSTLPSGVYFLKVNSEAGVESIRFLKK